MLGFGQKPENERNPKNGVLLWTYGLTSSGAHDSARRTQGSYASPRGAERSSYPNCTRNSKYSIRKSGTRFWTCQSWGSGAVHALQVRRDLPSERAQKVHPLLVAVDSDPSPTPLQSASPPGTLVRSHPIGPPLQQVIKHVWDSS